jgi:hypothetical protein
VVLSVFGLMATVASGATPKGSRGNPIPRHQTVSIPESEGWRIRVNGSVPNATRAVLAENQFNDPPAAGRQFFMINVTATYAGGGKSTLLGGVSFGALGRSNVAYDSGDSCGVVPKELDTFKDVFTGGKLTGNVCFSVRKSDVASLLLMVEPSISLNDRLVFFKTR